MPTWFPNGTQWDTEKFKHFREIGHIPTTPRSIFQGFHFPGINWFPEKVPDPKRTAPTLPPWTMATLAPGPTKAPGERPKSKVETYFFQALLIRKLVLLPDCYILVIFSILKNSVSFRIDMNSYKYGNLLEVVIFPIFFKPIGSCPNQLFA